MSGRNSLEIVEMRKDGCRKADVKIGGAGAARVSSCVECPFKDCKLNVRWYSEVRKDGCRRADKIVGGLSSCSGCPFDECVVGGVNINDEKLGELIKGIKVRPMLDENDLLFIARAFSVYGSESGVVEYERGNGLFNRLLIKQGFHTRRGEYVVKSSSRVKKAVEKKVCGECGGECSERAKLCKACYLKWFKKHKG